MGNPTRPLPTLTLRLSSAEATWSIESGHVLLSKATWLPTYLACVVAVLIEEDAIRPGGEPIALASLRKRLPGRVTEQTLRTYLGRLSEYGLEVELDADGPLPDVFLSLIGADVAEVQYVRGRRADWWRRLQLAATRRDRPQLVGGEELDLLLDDLRDAFTSSDWDRSAKLLADSRFTIDWLRHHVSTKTRDRIRPQLYESTAAFQMQFGDPVLSRTAGLQAIRAYAARGDLAGQARVFGVQSATLRMLGHLSAAVASAEMARQIVQADPAWQKSVSAATILASTAHFPLKIGDMATAERHVQEGRAVAERASVAVRYLEATIRLAEFAIVRRDFDTAARLLDDLRPEIERTEQAGWIQGWWWRYQVALRVAVHSPAAEIEPLWREAWRVNIAGHWHHQLSQLCDLASQAGLSEIVPLQKPSSPRRAKHRAR